MCPWLFQTCAWPARSPYEGLFFPSVESRRRSSRLTDPDSRGSSCPSETRRTSRTCPKISWYHTFKSQQCYSIGHNDSSHKDKSDKDSSRIATIVMKDILQRLETLFIAKRPGYISHNVFMTNVVLTNNVAPSQQLALRGSQHKKLFNKSSNATYDWLL